MMIISRQNNNIHYTYQPSTNTQVHSSNINKCTSSPLPFINRTPLHQIPLHKWYIVNREVVEHIVDTYIETLYNFLDKTPRYNVYVDEHMFRESMIKNLYNSSQNKNKHFI